MQSKLRYCFSCPQLTLEGLESHFLLIIFYTSHGRLTTLPPMKTLGITILLSFFLSLEVMASLGTPGVIPENHFSSPIMKNKKFETTLTEKDFNQVMEVISKIYTPLIQARSGLPLVIKTDWVSAVVNAYATRETDAWVIHITGGIARAKGMTKDSLALIACHELGHHLGGAPKTFLFGGWPSAEGQADYWATSKCLKKYYAEFAAEEISVEENIPEKVLSDCGQVYKDSNDEMKICVKSLLAVAHFSEFINKLPDARYVTSILAKDTHEVKATNTNDYPKPQCRIDTFYQGALCTISADTMTSEASAKVGNCNEGAMGTRPRCWYRP